MSFFHNANPVASLMKLLAIRLSPQAGKSLVIPRPRENEPQAASFEVRPSSVFFNKPFGFVLAAQGNSYSTGFPRARE